MKYAAVVLLSIAVSFSLQTSSALANSTSNSETRAMTSYNWLNTGKYIISDGKRHVFFGSPYYGEEGSGGTKPFWIILQYANSFAETDSLPEDGFYTFHLFAPGQHLELQLGFGWIGYQKKIALLDDADFYWLSKLAESRLSSVEDSLSDERLEFYINSAMKRSVPRHFNGEDNSRQALAKIEKIATEKVAEIREDTGRANREHNETDPSMIEIRRQSEQGQDHSSNQEANGTEYISESDYQESPLEETKESFLSKEDKQTISDRIQVSNVINHETSPTEKESHDISPGMLQQDMHQSEVIDKQWPAKILAIILFILSITFYIVFKQVKNLGS